MIGSTWRPYRLVLAAAAATTTTTTITTIIDDDNYDGDDNKNNYNNNTSSPTTNRLHGRVVSVDGPSNLITCLAWVRSPWDALVEWRGGKEPCAGSFSCKLARKPEHGRQLRFSLNRVTKLPHLC